MGGVALSFNSCGAGWGGGEVEGEELKIYFGGRALISNSCETGEGEKLKVKN